MRSLTVSSPHTGVLAALALAGRTTAQVSDVMRDGQRVMDTTITAISSDPDAWDGKWVRITGWAADDGSITVYAHADRGWPFVELNAKQAKPCSQYCKDDPPLSSVIVVGHVDTTCQSFWRSVHEEADAALKNEGTLLLFHPTGELKYCQSIEWPILEKAVLAIAPGTQQ